MEGLRGTFELLQIHVAPAPADSARPSTAGDVGNSSASVPQRRHYRRHLHASGRIESRSSRRSVSILIFIWSACKASGVRGYNRRFRSGPLAARSRSGCADRNVSSASRSLLPAARLSFANRWLNSTCAAMASSRWPSFSRRSADRKDASSGRASGEVGENRRKSAIAGTSRLREIFARATSRRSAATAASVFGAARYPVGAAAAIPRGCRGRVVPRGGGPIALAGRMAARRERSWRAPRTARANGLLVAAPARGRRLAGGTPSGAAAWRAAVKNSGT